MRLVGIDMRIEFRTPDPRQLRHCVKSITSQVSDGSRHLLTPDANSEQPSSRDAPSTHPQCSNLAHGRISAALKSAQFSFAFVPLAEGRDPSRLVPAPGRPTHPHSTVLISSLPPLRHPTCPNHRPRPPGRLKFRPGFPLTARLAELCSSDPER